MSKMKKYDFSGYATRNNIKCSDGRVILKDAFRHQDGVKVPLVWQHFRESPKNILGHGILENREDGVYVYCTFNDSEEAAVSKELVKHGDVDSLSIFANQLRQNGSEVLHGSIKEVSLVLAGANPGAKIDNVAIEHSDGGYGLSEEEVVIKFSESIKLEHAETDSEEKTLAEIFETFTEEEKEVAYYMINSAMGNETDVEAGEEDPTDEMGHEDGADSKSAKDIFEGMSKDKQEVIYYLIGKAVEDSAEQSDEDDEEETIEHDDNESKGGQKIMKKNAFDKQGVVNDHVNEETNTYTLEHDDFVKISENARQAGSYKKAFKEYLEHAAATYGVENIEFLFPEARELNKEPDFIKREMGWVSKFLSGVSKSPFSRIKTTHADITEDEARAKGYVKGNLKIEEVFKLLKRETHPTTVYKKQKLDRDDILDIVDMDIVTWMKAEMRLMLDEEIARAALIGDGRETSSTDKIDEEKIRPIYKDVELYSISVKLPTPTEAKAGTKAFMDAAVRSKKNYKGSGNPVMFIDVDMLTDIRLLEDTVGHKIYKTDAEIASALGVREIIECNLFENTTRMVETKKYALKGIMVNLSDYRMGSDKGGEINMFDDFDIDYNQMKYLLETRCSGALTKPYAAVVIEQEVPTVPAG